MGELDERTREQIRIEEQYRAEVRAQFQDIAPKPDERRSLLTFLNSSFGLWLLTAIFITGAGSLYTRWQAQHVEEQKKQEQTRAEQQSSQEYRQHLETEISHRLSQTLIHLWEISDRKQPHRLAQGHKAEEVRMILDEFATGTGPRLASLYPEFTNKSTLVLATELVGRFPDKKSNGESFRAVEDLSGLPVLMDVEHAQLSDPFSVAAALLRRLGSLTRYDRFYFLDCSGDGDPFC